MVQVTIQYGIPLSFCLIPCSRLSNLKELINGHLGASVFQFGECK